MPFYERGDVRIHYEEVGSGFPLMVIPGSHHGPTWDHHADGRFCGAMDPARCDVDFSKAVPLMGPAGSMTIHHARLVHGSALNTSNRQRRLLLHEYTAADAWPLMGVANFDDFNDRMVLGEPSVEPRIVPAPVRMPLPAAEHQGSIYENQRATGRRFFEDRATEAGLLAGVRRAVDAAGLWDELGTDWVCLDCELLPWSAKAQELLKSQYAAVGSAGRAAVPRAAASLAAAASRLGGDEKARLTVQLEPLAGLEGDGLHQGAQHRPGEQVPRRPGRVLVAELGHPPDGQDQHGRDGQPPDAGLPGAAPAGDDGVPQRAAKGPVKTGDAGIVLAMRAMRAVRAGQAGADGQGRIDGELGQ